MPVQASAGALVHLRDLMGPATYARRLADVVSRGLCLDLPAWGYHVFEVTVETESR